MMGAAISVLRMPKNTATTIRWTPADKARGRWLQKRLELGDQTAVARFCLKAVYDVLASGDSIKLYGLDAPVITEEEEEDDDAAED